MKDDGLSEPMIDKLILQRKELEKSGRNVSWSPIKKYNPKLNSLCNMGVENGWDTWQWQMGSNSSLNPPVWAGAPASNPAVPDFTIMSGAGIDPNTPGPNPGNPKIPVVCPGFGNNSIKIGDDCSVGSVCQQLTYSLNVSASDTTFVFAYAIVLEDAGHLPNESDFVEFGIYDPSGNLIPSGYFKYVGGPSMTGFFPVSGTGCAFAGADQYKPWGTVGINLSAYVGQTVTIVITNADCIYGGHFAYAYFDFACSPSATNMIINTSSTIDSCSAYKGTATVNILGGVAPYTFLWSNGQTTQTATGLSAGTYTVTIHDSNNLTGTNTVTVNNSMMASVSSTSVSCFGGNDGQALVSVSGGIPPYTYLWSNGITTNIALNLTTGTYTVITTDSSGCSVSMTVLVPGAPLLSSNLNNTASSCSSCPDGSAFTNVSGGTSPYFYQWSPGGQNTPAITGLLPGSYSVCVTDWNGCARCDSVKVGVVGITELFNSAITIFPNPSSENLFIDFGNRDFVKAELSFSDVVGRTFLKKIIKASGKQMIAVSDLPDGIYFLKLKTDYGIAEKKITISKK